MNREQQPTWVETHYIVFRAGEEYFITGGMPEEVAKILNQKLGGLICPVEIEYAGDQDNALPTG